MHDTRSPDKAFLPDGARPVRPAKSRCGRPGRLVRLRPLQYNAAMEWRRSLYDDDIHAWAEQQAGALRRLAETGRDLPNELDLQNVAEEIEDVGTAQRNACESFIRLIFVHLIKLHAAANSPAAQHWRGEIVGFHNELLQRLTPSMHPRIDLASLWNRAVKEAQAKLGPEADLRDLVLAKISTPPLAIEALAREDFDVDAALSALRGAAG